MKGGGGVAILFIIAERASSTIQLSSPPLLEALLHLARVAKVWANAPSPHGARMIFSRICPPEHTPMPCPPRALVLTPESKALIRAKCPSLPPVPYALP